MPRKSIPRDAGRASGGHIGRGFQAANIGKA